MPSLNKHHEPLQSVFENTSECLLDFKLDKSVHALMII